VRDCSRGSDALLLDEVARFEHRLERVTPIGPIAHRARHPPPSGRDGKPIGLSDLVACEPRVLSQLGLDADGERRFLEALRVRLRFRSWDTGAIGAV
jgi:hypothetical protein